MNESFNESINESIREMTMFLKKTFSKLGKLEIPDVGQTNVEYRLDYRT